MNSLNELDQYTEFLQTKEGKEISERYRKAYIEGNQNQWKAIGGGLKRQREGLGLNKTNMAELIGCSRSKLTKFENGEPISSAKMMENGYRNAIELIRVKNNKKIQSFSEPETWSDDERIGFNEVLQLWISAYDHSYDLYKFLREIHEGDEHLPRTDYSDKLYDLLIADLQNEYLLDLYNEVYRKEKAEYEQYLLSNKEGTLIQ